jgi:hypothetical protein
MADFKLKVRTATQKAALDSPAAGTLLGRGFGGRTSSLPRVVQVQLRPVAPFQPAARDECREAHQCQDQRGRDCDEAQHTAPPFGRLIQKWNCAAEKVGLCRGHGRTWPGVRRPAPAGLARGLLPELLPN